MQSLKSYFAPGSPDREKKRKSGTNSKISDLSQPAPSFKAFSEYGRAADTASLDSFSSHKNPFGDGRSVSTNEMAAIRADVTASWLHTKQQRLAWTTNLPGEGVVIKATRDSWTSSPPELSTVRGGFFDAVARLNVKASESLSCNIET